MMKILLTSILLCFATIGMLEAQQPGNFHVDNGNLAGSFADGTRNDWEETVIIRAPAPGQIKKVFIYLTGTVAKKDTIWIVGDPTDGPTFPPSIFCRYINSYAGFIIDYTGQQGWHELDVEYLNLKSGGINSIGVQHLIKPGGPYFGVDTKAQAQNNVTSFLADVFRPNPQFYNLRGTIASATPGSYMAGVQIEYDNVDSEGKPLPAPNPTLIDVTIEAGLVDNAGNPIKSAIASVADWNNDGLDDIAIAGGHFFKNNRNGTFTNVSSSINVSNSGTIWGDIDNDGYLDFFAVRGWDNDKIYFGNGDGTFTEDTDPTVVMNAPTVSPMWIDYDMDGLLDLFIAYGRKEEGGTETFYPDQLFRNLGNRKFENVTVKAGIAAGEPAPYYDCWGASITDYNDDGLPDIFVATYRLAPDLLYRNNGNGTFTEVGASTGARGVATYSPQYFGHGMGSDWGDYDNDGDLDLVVGNLGHPDERALSSNRSLLLENKINENNKFEDVTEKSRLQFYEMNAGAAWLDIDNDGYLDLVHCQYAYYAKDAGKAKNTRFYRNLGADYLHQLEDNTWQWGAYIHGAWSPVRIDYNRDGKMDILVASSNDYVKLFKNNVAQNSNYINFKVKGKADSTVNSSGYGSKITVDIGSKQFHRFLPGSVLNARASQSSNDLHFGLGDAENIVSVVVRFSDGHELTFDDLLVNKTYSIDYEGNIDLIPQSGGTSVSENIANRHVSIYPNPVTGNSTIEYNVSYAGNVNLSIYDMSGIEIMSLKNEFTESGNHLVNLNGKDLPNGAYVLRYTTNNVIYSHKFIVAN
ncbi:MAG: hypothetical protein CVV22_10080 [Ignavibacteriae bacterium HGW-Ignavibacteriae-1]|jgi:flagellar hook assembly protein FlgD|nr:MAG: hypothetical protein CVV22_10080 [Ignavibacteriae bacterium HGW-Ignavibacteriae-1]